MVKNKKIKEIQTRKNEVRLTTTDPKEMHGKYLARNLLRTWQENFCDEDTGEVVSIERNEFIIRAGEFIDGDTLAQIRFHMEAGDITEVEVSNQRRDATMCFSNHCWPWSVTAAIDGKKRRFLLYATSAHNALEIAQDYIELNFSGFFEFKQVKIFDYCIFLQDFTEKSPDGPDAAANDFYKIKVEVLADDESVMPYTFVLPTKDIDTGMVIINDWIAKKIKEEAEKQGDTETGFTTTVKSGTVIPCFRIIEKEFSDAYTIPGGDNQF